MRYKNQYIRHGDKRGVALIVVLILIVTTALLSMAFMSRSDVELACGQNMTLRSQTDYTAESAMEHAKGMILYPQDVAGEYWTGVNAQQLANGTDYYYDVVVTKLGHCDYKINCLAYKEKAGVQTGRSALQTELRLDPVIAYYQSLLAPIPAEIIINGDVYCDTDLANFGRIFGDVYSPSTVVNPFPGIITGKINDFTAQPPVDLPSISISDFSSRYYIGADEYMVANVGADQLQDMILGPTVSNPAGIYYRDGNLDLRGNINITGMLVVRDDLRIDMMCNVTITAVKNFPALLVGHDIIFNNSNQHLNVTGLVQVRDNIDMNNSFGSRIDVLGALYILGDGAQDTAGCSINITGSPDKAAIEIWSSEGVPTRWSPAAGAFFKSIQRQ
ncbi:hypothetical protein ACFL3G_01380 [Planctomycetota bacterium]